MLAGCSNGSTKPAAAGGAKGGETQLAALQGAAARLPAQAGIWTRPATARRITAETIFDYMDGGGELYLAYRFDHLDVLEYKAADPAAGTILVELYQMQSPDDAFGLLSTDWTGEPIETGEEQSQTASGAIAAAPPHHALYGAGLLRLWTGSLYARVMASREAAIARDAVRKIGRARVGAGGPRAFPPTLLVAIPRDAAVTPPGQEIKGPPLRADRTCFFRSYLVLNSQYFLASQDILALGASVAAATTEYAPAGAGSRPLRLIVVRYPSREAAAAAAATFRRAYLPESAKSRAGATSGTARTEHGFAAWSLEGPGLAIVLDAGSVADAERLAVAAARGIPLPGVGPAA